MRRLVVICLVLGVAGCSSSAPSAPAPAAGPFSVVETSIPDLQEALSSGRITSRQLVLAYLARIATYEDRLNAIITVNPHALEEADRLDAERAAGRVRGPLHGIPVALKDNIHTTDVRKVDRRGPAFRDLMPPYDAT
ncbi:MAG: amidase family protein [Vicinamibacterales bacterium]